MIKNNKGFSLITTLVLSAVALAFIGALAFFIQSGARVDSTTDSYKGALELAKGSSELLMKAIDESRFDCDTFSKIDADAFIVDYEKSSIHYSINFSNCECKDFFAGTNSGELYICTVHVQRLNRDERVIVDFGYMKNYY